MRDEGPRSVVYGPLRMGTPYKLYARAAAVEDEAFSSFFLWSIPGRLERMLPVTPLASVVGFLARSRIARRRRAALAFYGTLWLAVYVVYVIRIGLWGIRRRTGSGGRRPVPRTRASRRGRGFRRGPRAASRS